MKFIFLPKEMKGVTQIISVAVALVFIAGCATDGTQPATTASPKPSGYPITGASALQLSADYKFMPSLSGYLLPAGFYEAEREDASGVFFKAPKGTRSLSVAGSAEVEGGIYLPKQNAMGVRGHAYLRLPLVGESSYFLPDAFFAAYGKSWGVIPGPDTYVLNAAKIDGVFQGLAEIWSSPTIRVAGGLLRDGKPDGVWTFWDSRGAKIVTLTYRDGELNGPVEMWYGSFTDPRNAGNIKLRGTLLNGLWNGTVSQFYSDGLHLLGERTYQSGHLISAHYAEADAEKISGAQIKSRADADDSSDKRYIHSLQKTVSEPLRMATTQR